MKMHTTKRSVHLAKARFFAGAALATAYLLVGMGCETKEERMVNEWQAGCSAGNLNRCADFGEAYAKGLGVPASPAKAVEILQKACDSNGARACMLLGRSYADGTGVPKDTTRASTLLGKACDGNEEEACVQGCDLLGDAVRCLRVAVLSQKGAKDLVRAAAFFRKGCEKGHPLACREASVAYRDGIGVPKDADKAAELFKRGDQLFKSVCGAANKPDYCTNP